MLPARQQEYVQMERSDVGCARKVGKVDKDLCAARRF